MTRILVVYHSQTGRTEKMAKAVAAGAKAIEHTEVILKKAGEATIDDLPASTISRLHWQRLFAAGPKRFPKSGLPLYSS